MQNLTAVAHQAARWGLCPQHNTNITGRCMSVLETPKEVHLEHQYSLFYPSNILYQCFPHKIRVRGKTCSGKAPLNFPPTCTEGHIFVLRGPDYPDHDRWPWSSTAYAPCHENHHRGAQQFSSTRWWDWLSARNILWVFLKWQKDPYFQLI